MQTPRRIPLIIAAALIMQQIDSTALATAIPAMAREFDASPVGMHSVITSYLLALGIFLPVSGWAADRFGARAVFCSAMLLFTVASLACGLATSLPQLVACRIVQGFGAALMLPVGRLILVRSVPRAELVTAMIWMSLPAVVGPAIGPLLGGFLTTTLSWHWIFWINLPVGAVAIALTLAFIPDVSAPGPRRFDHRGFLLAGVCIGASMLALDLAPTSPLSQTALLGAVGAVFLLAYLRHARRAEDPILDLRLFRHATFRVSVTGGSVFRAGFGAIPFLLPLLMQQVFGYSAFKSGAITFVSAIGAFGMRTVARRILKAFGFRKVLIWNALISGAVTALCATFSLGLPLAAIIAVILIGGVFRALQITSVNTVAFADVTAEETSHATTMSQMAQRLSQGIGVAFSALMLHLFSRGEPAPDATAFALTFLVVGVISALSFVSFLRLPDDAGDAMAGRDRAGG